MRSVSPGSSRGSRSVRSQEPFDDEDGLHGASNLQVEFLTQAPPSSSPLNRTDHGSEMVLSPSTIVNSNNIIQALFDKPRIRETDVQGAQSYNEAFAGMQAPQSPIPLPVSAVPVRRDPSQASNQESDQNEDDRKSGEMDFDEVEQEQEEQESDADEDELPQQQIIVHGTEFLSSALYKPARQVEHALRTASELNNQLPVMPDAMLDIMRAFRDESLNGRYIPRRLQRIPKAQQDLLQMDESWQPPLIGKPKRLGTVPQDLLNTLIERTDRDAVTNNIRMGELAEQAGDYGRVEAQQTLQVSAGDQTPASSKSSLDSDATTVPWSVSPTPPPKRSRLELPPDTPDENEFGNNGDRLRARDSMSESTDRTSQNPSRRQRRIVRSSTEPQSQEAVTPARTSLQSTANIHTTQSFGPGVMSQEKASTNPFTQPPKRINDNHSAHKSVKVHRTPYLNYSADSSSPLHGQSSGSTTYLVPATYDEQQRADMTRKKKESEVSLKASNQNELLEFEANSSEDGGPMFNGVPVPIVGRKLTTREERNSRAILDKGMSRMSAAMSSQIRKKRKETDVDDSKETRRKRNRIAMQQDGEDRVLEDTYTPIDDSRRRNRRQFYQELQERRQSTEQIEAHAIGESSTQKRSVGSVDLDVRSGSKVFSIPKANENASTSDTGLSTHAATSNISKPAPLKRMSDSLQTKSTVSFGLFADFKTTYPDYEGQEHHFIATCQLLKSLRDKARATHPSIWDDFVYRHYHDYRDHLDMVRETCGNAMPYEVFYETCVEQPTHHKRIIRPAHLDMPLPIANFTAPPSKTVEDKAAGNSASIRIGARLIEKVHGEHEEETAAQDIQVEDPVRSQESAHSVHLWLERAAGAQSPELGTPEISVRHNTDVPPLSLQRPETTSPSHDRVVVLPRPLLQESSESARSRSKPSDKSDTRMPDPSMQTPRNTTSAPRSTSFPSTRKKSAITSSARSYTQILTPSRAQVRAKEHIPSALSKPQASQSTSQTHAFTGKEGRKVGATKPKPQLQSKTPAPPRPSQQIDTVFTRFMRDYNNLACERGVHTDDPNIQYADFSWITTDYSSSKTK